MLENIQKRFQTVVLAGLVGLLSAAFLLTFGGPNGSGCGAPSASSIAAQVYGQTITAGDFNAAYALAGHTRESPERARAQNLREVTLDGIVERELLAHEAERMGLTADPREVMREVAESGVVWSTPSIDSRARMPGPQIPTGGFNDRDGRFSSRNLRNFIQYNLRRSVEEFEEWQVRERMAQSAREAVLSTVSVSPEEIRHQYVNDTDRAALELVRFNPTYYRDRIETNDAQLREWITGHQEAVDSEYQRQRHRYTGLEEQRRARHILIKAAADAPAEERTAARERAEALLRRARAGEDFATLARANSEDTGSARNGGDLGYNARGRMVAPFDEAQFGTDAGQITDHVVESSFGYHVIQVVGRREGDVPEDEAKLEIAEGLYRLTRARELAREDADRALAFLREGHSAQELDERLAWNWNEPTRNADGSLATAPERDTFAPAVRDTRSFGRSETIVPGTNAGVLTRAAFERTTTEPVPSEPIQVGEDWYVFRLKSRTEATDEGFTDDVKTRIREQLLAGKQGEVLRQFVRRLRDRAERDGQLRIEDEILQYGVDAPTEESGEEPAEEQES